MTVQTFFTASAAGLAALYFLRGTFQSLRIGRRPGGNACGGCHGGGCPVARGAHRVS